MDTKHTIFLALAFLAILINILLILFCKPVKNNANLVKAGLDSILLICVYCIISLVLKL
jgi:hypothetical protein